MPSRDTAIDTCRGLLEAAYNAIGTEREEKEMENGQKERIENQLESIVQALDIMRGQKNDLVEQQRYEQNRHEQTSKMVKAATATLAALFPFGEDVSAFDAKMKDELTVTTPLMCVQDEKPNGTVTERTRKPATSSAASRSASPLSNSTTRSSPRSFSCVENSTS